MIELRKRITEMFKSQGADLVGFGSIDRFEKMPVLELMPTAKTIICAAFRVLRGSNRGIEDGTTYYQYTTMAIETIEENVMPIAMLRVCNLIEDAGYLALPQRRHQTVMQNMDGTNPEIEYEEIMHGRTSEIELDFNAVAAQCGLGEIGEHGALLTSSFGPFQRICAIITDIELEPTPISQLSLCDHCGECRLACPGHALDDGKIDPWQCAAYYMGANMHKNPFLPPDAFSKNSNREAIISGSAKLTEKEAKEIIDQILYYPPIKHGYCSSICGKACHRACYIHLEKNGKLDRAFKHLMRKGEDWSLPLLPEK